MKKVNKSAFAFILGAIMLFACSEEFLNVNENPNVANEGQVGLLLTAAQGNIGAELSEGLGRGGSIFTRQLYDLGQSAYAITGATFQQDWNSLYAGGLKDLKEVLEIGITTENEGYQGISKVLSAYVFHHLVDFQEL